MALVNKTKMASISLIALYTDYNMPALLYKQRPLEFGKKEYWTHLSTKRLHKMIP